MTVTAIDARARLDNAVDRALELSRREMARPDDLLIPVDEEGNRVPVEGLTSELLRFKQIVMNFRESISFAMRDEDVLDWSPEDQCRVIELLLVTPDLRYVAETRGQQYGVEWLKDNLDYWSVQDLATSLVRYSRNQVRRVMLQAVDEAQAGKGPALLELLRNVSSSGFSSSEESHSAEVEGAEE